VGTMTARAPVPEQKITEGLLMVVVCASARDVIASTRFARALVRAQCVLRAGARQMPLLYPRWAYTLSAQTMSPLLIKGLRARALARAATVSLLTAVVTVLTVPLFKYEPN